MRVPKCRKQLRIKCFDLIVNMNNILMDILGLIKYVTIIIFFFVGKQILLIDLTT